MMPGIQNGVVLGVDDLAVTRDFYTRLGWRARPRDGLFASFQLEGATLVLFPRELLEGAVGLRREGAGFNGMTSAMLLPSAEAVDEALDIAEAAGATVLSRATDRPWGSRTAYFADPEGNVWELACIPGTIQAEAPPAPSHDG